MDGSFFRYAQSPQKALQMSMFCNVRREAILNDENSGNQFEWSELLVHSRCKAVISSLMCNYVACSCSSCL